MSNMLNKTTNHGTLGGIVTLVLAHEQNGRRDSAGTCDQWHAERKHADIVCAVIIAAGFRRTPAAPFGTLLKEHFDGDQKQHQAAGDLKRGQADTEEPEHRLSEHREQEQQNACGDDGARRDLASLARRGVWRQRQEDRHQTDRVDGNEIGRERRQHHLGDQCGIEDCVQP